MRLIGITTSAQERHVPRSTSRHSAKRCSRPVRSNGSQGGIGLIEVLLAVVLVSIGFLAAARMQVQSMSTSQNNYALSQAKYIVLDMSERMRANRDAMEAGDYAGLETATGKTQPDCVINGTACTPADRVNADLYAWSLSFHPAQTGMPPLLPSATGVTAKGSIALNGSIYEVKATWAERVVDDPDPVERSYSVQVIP